jgi:hypothetical protein
MYFLFEILICIIFSKIILCYCQQNGGDELPGATTLQELDHNVPERGVTPAELYHTQLYNHSIQNVKIDRSSYLIRTGYRGVHSI